MGNKELLKEISQAKNQAEDQEKGDQEKNVKFLVFEIKEKQYALYADQVREIVIDVPLFYIPFVPPYIRGVINRHGEPYTVFDLHLFFEKENLSAETYLILNVSDDQLAILISNILEIVKVGESQVHSITSSGDGDPFFLGSITLKENEVFILNLPGFLARLENDLDVH